VRRDLPLGDLAAQLVHAAGESASLYRPSVEGSDKLAENSGLPDDTHAVVLAVEGEDELVALSARLERAGVPHKLIREPDAPFNGAATALGIVPCLRRPLRRFLSRYPLLKEK